MRKRRPPIADSAGGRRYLNGSVRAPGRPVGGAASLVSGEPLSRPAVKAAMLGKVLLGQLDELSREGGAAVIPVALDLVCLHIVTVPGVTLYSQAWSSGNEKAAPLIADSAGGAAI
jgi:hypothetical protein